MFRRLIEFSLVFVLILTLAGLLLAYGTLQDRVANYVLGQPGFDGSSYAVDNRSFWGPSNVVKDAEGNIWVADSLNNRVVKFAYQDYSPYIYADTMVDLYLGQAHFITRNAGAGDSQLNNPQGLVFDDSGNLYVADQLNNRVVRYNADSDGVIRDTSADLFLGGGRNGSDSYANTAGASDTMLSSPVGLVLDDSGNLYVADAGNDRVVRFDASGTRVIVNDTADFVIGQRMFFQSGSGLSDTMFSSPIFLAVDFRNNLYVADYGNTRVLRFDANPNSSNLLTDTQADFVIGQAGFFGSITGTSDTMMGRPLGLVFTEGNLSLFVSDTDNNRVLRFDAGSTGVISDTTAHFFIGQQDLFKNVSGTGDTQLNGPAGMTIGQEDRLHLCDMNNNRILLYDARHIPNWQDDPNELDCFVATVAFGGRDDERVVAMRAFRDSYVMRSRLGRSFCSFYYDHGPAAAKWLSGHDAVKSAARLALLPAGGLALVSMNFGAVSLLLFGLAAFLISSFLHPFFRRE